MRTNYGKKILLALMGLCCASSVVAADNTANAQAGGASNAIAFAMQAGQIAGSAQGCGINIATFTTRVSEAINKLALNPTDSSSATATFQQTLQQAQIAQRNNNIIPCSQVTQDFTNLPILRPDYEQSVIAQLNPGMTNNPAANPSASANSPAAAQPGQAGMSNNNTMIGSNSLPNQQQNLNNQVTSPVGASSANSNNTNVNNQANKNAAPSNPAYPQQNYGPMKSFSNNFSGAVKPYGMANSNYQAGNNAQSAPANASNNSATNTPPPPSFSNPNNAPAANNP